MRLFLIGLGIVLSLVFFFAVILPAARQAEKEPVLTTLTRPTQAWKFDVDAFILRWDADRDGMMNRDELRKSVGNRLEGLEALWRIR